MPRIDQLPPGGLLQATDLVPVSRVTGTDVNGNPAYTDVVANLGSAATPGSITALQSQVATLSTTVAPVAGQITNLQSQVTTLQTAPTAIPANILALPAAVTTLQTTTAPIPGQVSALQTTTAPVPGQITALQNAVTPLQASVVTLQNTTAPIPAQVSALQSTVSPIPAQIAALQAAVAALQTTPTVSPTLVLPVSISTLAATAATITGITYTDTTATNTSPNYTFSFACLNGTMSAGPTGSLISGSGTVSAGTTAVYPTLQAALNSLTYTGPAGSDTITVTISRPGGTTRTGTIAVTTYPVAGTVLGPSNGYPLARYPTAASAVVVSTTVLLGGVSFVDPPAVAGNLAGTLTATTNAGTLTMTNPSGGGLTGSGTASLSLPSTVPVANTALGTLTLTAPGTAGTATVTVKYVDALGFSSQAVLLSVAITSNPALTPPSDPGMAVPTTLVMPLNSTHVITNFDWVDSVGATNTGDGAINLTMTGTGTISVTLSGSGSFTSGGNNSQFMQIQATWADLQTIMTTLTVHSPASAGTAQIVFDGYSGFGQEEGGTTQITYTAGATAAETGGYVTGTVVASPTVPSDVGGVQAFRVADVMNRFGATFYPSFTGGSQDGGIETVTGSNDILACIRYIVGSSGHGMIARTYVYDTSFNAFWGPVAQSGGSAGPCVAIDSSPNGMISTMQYCNTNGYVGNYGYAEGINEPDNQFGSGGGYYGGASPTLANQQALYNACHPLGIKVASPSITGIQYGAGSYSQAGNNYYGASVQNFWGGSITAAIAASDYIATHLYPQHGSANGSNQLYQWTEAASAVWGGKPSVITEYHPTMYNGTQYLQVSGTTNQALSDSYCAAWTPLALASAVLDHNCKGLLWFCNYDYGTAFGIGAGLFQTNASQPRPQATTMRIMYQLLGDSGLYKQTFAPGKLAYSQTGLPALGSDGYSGGRIRVLQCSDGTFRMIVSNEQNTLPSGSTVNVVITFTATMTSITDTSVTNPVSYTPTSRTVTNTNTITVALSTGAEMRILKIVHP